MHDRYRTSRTLLSRARRSLPGGVSSPFRARSPVPRYFQDGCGSRLRDVDGNEYVDYALAWGPLILGHRHPLLVETLRRQAERPHNYGAQHELEYEVAERMIDLIPCADRVAFTSSGSEAVQLALRLARAATGRNLVLRFEGHYHGWMDSVLLSYRPGRHALQALDCFTPTLGSRGQVPNSMENVVSVPWNRTDVVEDVFRRMGDRIAAVITEPVLCNSGCLLPESGYLQELRRITQQHGAILIFDEIITGFRIATGGARQHYGVVPDLATFGKALAAGLPVSAVAGRADILDLIAGGGVAFGGTFNGNAIVLAAAKTTLEVLSAGGGNALRWTNELGCALMETTRRLAGALGVPLQVTGFGSAFALHFTARTRVSDYRDTLDDNADALGRFLMAALDEGIYLLADGRIYVSLAHTERDVEQTKGAFERALRRVA